MKVSVLILCISVCGWCARAQYYYYDILANLANQKNYTLLQQEKIKKVTVNAFGNDGEVIDDFILYQEIDPSKKTITTFSKSNQSDASILQTFFNESNKPSLVIDSSAGATTRTRFIYGPNGLLESMQSQSIQLEQKENVVNEERKYTYNQNGAPDTMVRIIGATDTMLVRFTLAENGLPGEEQWFKAGKKIENWFYYYDGEGNLTDIVRYNAAAGQLLPDYLFGYDALGNMTQKVTVMPDTKTFRIWQFAYNEKGLKTEEKVLNRQRQQEGRLVFLYKN